MTAPPLSGASTGAVRYACNAETRTAGSGNFHYLTNKAFKRVRRSGGTMSKGAVDRSLKRLEQSGALARMALAEEGFSWSDDPTAWDALVNVIREGL